MFSTYFNDRVHRQPRIWSNKELRKFAPLFGGNVINVSAWTDTDKEGGHYRDYFSQAGSYSISNYKEGMRGFQGQEGEIFLDLTAELSPDLVEAYDVVFNHTTLEHIYDFRTAFENLCRMSRDLVIIVLPFVQQMHSDYGDYWRFSPMATANLYAEFGLEVGYLSFTTVPNSSVYVFGIGSKQPDRWKDQLPFEYSFSDSSAVLHEAPLAGCRIISEPLLFRVSQWLKQRFSASRIA